MNVDHDTLRAALEARRARGGGIPRYESPRAPLTPTQFGLWYAQRLDASDPGHHRTTVLRITGPLDVDRLRDALQRLVERHEPLRTIYPHDGGTPEQLVLDEHTVPLDVVDATADATRVDAVVADADRRVVDVAREVPFGATLVRRTIDDHVLVLAVSHLAIDGTSEDVLVRELAALYDGRALEPLPLRIATGRRGASRRDRATARRATSSGGSTSCCGRCRRCSSRQRGSARRVRPTRRCRSTAPRPQRCARSRKRSASRRSPSCSSR